MYKFAFVTGLILFSAWPLLGGQAPGPKTTTQPDDAALRKDDLTSKDVLEEVIRRAKEGQITAQTQAALCPICHQPLYKHTDDFTCTPTEGTVQKIDFVRATCPVCKTPFKGAKQGNLNEEAGRDRDFCTHSVGRYAVYASVWMCPECGYAAAIDAFSQREPLKPELTQFVKSKLTAETKRRIKDLAGFGEGRPIPPDQLKFSEYIDQTMVPDWMKYENALALVEAGMVRLPHAVQAKLYCEAAHASRRLMAAELALLLDDQQLQISLGQSVRRVNDWLMAECRKVREERQSDLSDPAQLFLKAERDPGVLQEGAKRLDRKIEEIIRLESLKNDPTKQTQVSRLDQYVFHMHYAGILDRVGDLDGAVAQLEKAQTAIPNEMPASPQPVEPATKAFVERIFKSMQEAAAQRVGLIQKEKKYLFLAADQLMQALYFGELARTQQDPAMNCYLIGELLRRSQGEPAAALAWFQAARQLFEKIDPAGARPEIPTGTPADEAAARIERVKQNLQKKKDTMLSWTEAQLALVKEKAAGKEPGARIKDAIAKVLAGGAGPGAAPGTTAAMASGNDLRIPEETPTKPLDLPNLKPVPAEQPKIAVTPPKSGLTRETLLKRYYEAIQTHFQKNGDLPKSLNDLVAAKLLKPEDACLNEKGQLICPETNSQLLYFPPAALGSHSPIIFPGSKDPNRIRLFADGQVGEK